MNHYYTSYVMGEVRDADGLEAQQWGSYSMTAESPESASIHAARQFVMHRLMQKHTHIRVVTQWVDVHVKQTVLHHFDWKINEWAVTDHEDNEWVLNNG